MTAEQPNLPVADPLTLAEQALDALGSLPLERHPQIFSRFDELLRDALESPPQVGSG